MQWPVVTLDDVFMIARGGSPRPIDAFLTDDRDGVNWIMIGDASEGSKYISKTKKRIRREGVSRSRSVKPGDLLLTNSMSFGRPYILNTSGCIHDGWLVLSPRRRDADPNFFYHLLGSGALYEQFARLAAGAVVKNLNIDLVKGVRVSLPPFSEQRRIADLLDKADAIRLKRKEAIAITEELFRSAFLEMFGDSVTNPMGWEFKPLGALLSIPLRNGLSPASGGTYPARLLILSAITRGRFDAGAVKDGFFAVEPWSDVRLDGRDFLICRGNGNLALVGTGAFPATSDYSVVFPDTMIAARIDESLVSPAFFASIWRSPFVRRQIESGARTTNGTYKVNQGVIESVRIPVPDREKQREFEAVAQRISRLLEIKRKAAKEAEVLFDSLVYRAFEAP